jgi:flagellar hook-basal body complex protein FliE
MPTIPAAGGIAGVPGIGGGEWDVGSVGSLDGTPTTGAAGGGGGFGSMLGNQISALEKSQSAAADASRSLADGTATDPTAAVVAVERAQLSMQLAAQLRTKGVEALSDILHTQV